MALKRNFEDISGLESPFVDEVVNPGTSPREVERQAVRSNQLFLAQQRADELISGSRKPVVKKVAPKGTIQKLKAKKSKFEEALAAAQGR